MPSYHGFHRRHRTSGVPTSRRWWRWATINHRIQLCNAAGWSRWWPFCQACTGWTSISASVCFILCGSLEFTCSVWNTAAWDAASQLHLLQRHTSPRPRHFLDVTNDADGRPLLSMPLTPIWSSQNHCTFSVLVGQTSHLQRTRTQSVCGYLLDSMFLAHRIETTAWTSSFVHAFREVDIFHLWL